jgi:hypothetical protein
MIRHTALRRSPRAFLAASAILVVALLAGFSDLSAWARGFRGGGFAMRYSDGGFANRFNDGGFGDGGFGSIHQSDLFSGWSHQGTADQDASQLQQNRFNEANTLQQNRYDYAKSLQKNSQDYWNNDNHYDHYGNYYGGLAAAEGVAVGSWLATAPLAAVPIYVSGPPYYYYYDNGVYYAPQGSGYAVVDPPAGVVVPTAPPGCSESSPSGDGKYMNCGGTYYSSVPKGYQVIAPPVGSTVNAVPAGAQKETVNGVTYYMTTDHIFYRPFFSGSAVIYQVVANPL